MHPNPMRWTAKLRVLEYVNVDSNLEITFQRGSGLQLDIFRE